MLIEDLRCGVLATHYHQVRWAKRSSRRGGNRTNIPRSDFVLSLRTFTTMRRRHSLIIEDNALRESMPAWASLWHVWTVVIPRRGVGGDLVWGRVWRRHDGHRWTYARLRDSILEEPAATDAARLGDSGGSPVQTFLLPSNSDS